MIVVKTKEMAKGLKPDWGKLFQDERPWVTMPSLC